MIYIIRLVNLIYIFLIFSVISTCFAFGATGAGKTYTLLGSRSTAGLYEISARDLIGAIHSHQHGRGLQLWVSYYEIYCNQLYDLLNKRKRYGGNSNSISWKQLVTEYKFGLC